MRRLGNWLFVRTVQSGDHVAVASAGKCCLGSPGQGGAGAHPIPASERVRAGLRRVQLETLHPAAPSHRGWARSPWWLCVTLKIEPKLYLDAHSLSDCESHLCLCLHSFCAGHPSLHSVPGLCQALDPASGPLHRLFFRLGTLCPQIFMPRLLCTV